MKTFFSHRVWKTPAPWSLRRQLLVGILLPLLIFIGVNTWSLYQDALHSLHTAYDRTLLASAKSISEQLNVKGYDHMAQVEATVPYSALEIFEADNQSRMFYRVSTLEGEMVSGFAELPFWRGEIPMRPPYAALVDFYDAEFRDQPVRVAVLLQPVASHEGRSMVVIQVAETLELRHAQTVRLLRSTLWRQAGLLVVIILTVLFVVQRVTQPVRRISQQIADRSPDDLSSIAPPVVPREMRPLLEAINQVMYRLQQILLNQKRFVRDAAHQLRTPLAVLKLQVQSARQGDVEPMQALAEIESTVDRATALANQMLALAKVEQIKQQLTHEENPSVAEWSAIVREIALDLAPLVADKALDFELHAEEELQIQASDWMLRELTRNLLHNAIRHSPSHSPLVIRLQREQQQAVLWISDHGPGISTALRQRLFQPFAAGEHIHASGSGLGLAICHEIVQALRGTIVLNNRIDDANGFIMGLDSIVHLPLSDSTSLGAAKHLQQRTALAGKISP